MDSNSINHNVLIIDSDPTLARVVLQTLAEKAIHGTVATTSQKAIEYLSEKIWDLVLVNHSVFENTNIAGPAAILRKIRGNRPELPVVLLSESDSSEKAINALRAGFCEFVLKPLSAQNAFELIDSFLPGHKTTTLAAAQESGRHIYQIIGASPALKRTIDIAEKVAPTSVPVLITGPSGAGKELIAQLIHHKSQRRFGPFVKINCAALNDSLLESELFGHEKGAFTGAMGLHRGRFERADGGTLLLDEITETTPAFQSKLLRVLEQMNFERVGGTENIDVNVRVISTTNSDILSHVENGSFRLDLYYRLAGVRVHLPGLAERPQDIEQLIWYFVNIFSAETKRKVSAIDSDALDMLRNYRWPGNVRQLRNLIRTALIMGKGTVLSIEDIACIGDELGRNNPRHNQTSFDLTGKTLQQLEQNAIIQTLRHTGGNRIRAANMLGISDRTLRDKVKRYQQEEVFSLIQ